MGSPFAPNKVPAPVCAAALAGKPVLRSVGSWNFQGALPIKEKYRPCSAAMILSGETAAKWIGCVAGRYRNSTQRLKQKKMRATSVTALAQKITLFNINDIICELIQLVNNFFQKFKRSCYQFVSFWTFKIINMPLHSTVYEFSELLYPTFFDGRANNFVISI